MDEFWRSLKYYLLTAIPLFGWFIEPPLGIIAGTLIKRYKRYER